MSKEHNYSLLFGTIAALIDLGKQQREINTGKREKISGWELLGWFGTGYLGSRFLFSLLADSSDSNHSKAQYKPARHLRGVLQKLDPKASSDHDYLQRKGAEVIDFLNDELNGYAYKAQVSGSVAKGTNIAGGSDIDILLPYKKHSYRSLETMFEDTGSLLEELKATNPELRRIRRQGKSYGLQFSDGIRTVDVDVVPAKEQSDFLKNGDLSLRVEDNGFFGKATYIKTNLKKQKKFLGSSKGVLDVVKLLKHWKNELEVEVKSVELENLVARAFSHHGQALPKDPHRRLMIAATYIEANIDTIALKDPGRPSVSLLNDPSRRSSIKRDFRSMLQDIQADPANIERHFPLPE